MNVRQVSAFIGSNNLKSAISAMLSSRNSSCSRAFSLLSTKSLSSSIALRMFNDFFKSETPLESIDSEGLVATWRRSPATFKLQLQLGGSDGLNSGRPILLKFDPIGPLSSLTSGESDAT